MFFLTTGTIHLRRLRPPSPSHWQFLTTICWQYPSPLKDANVLNGKVP